MHILCRCNIVLNGWVTNDFSKCCSDIIEQHNIKDVHGNYRDAYPIVAAVLLDAATQMLNGSSYLSTNHEQKRLAHKFMKYKLDV